MAAKSVSDIAALLSMQKAKLAQKTAAEAETPPVAVEMGAPVRARGGGDDGTPSVTPPPDGGTTSPPSGLKRKRDDDEDAAEVDIESDSGGEATRFDPKSPIRKGAAHIDPVDAQPTYTSRAAIPPQTSTANVRGLPHDIRACRKVGEFKRLNEIAEGTFGKVWRARDEQTGRVMALKQVKMEKEREGFPITALREVDILMNLNHENIVCVQELVVGKRLDSVYLVMEYVEHDVKFVMDKDGLNHKFTLAEVKNLFQQLLKGVAFMHRNWILHRDLKTSNILYTNKGVLKICDFGLARLIGSAPADITPGTCTLWSRSPEVLLDSLSYGFPSDMWAVGCICAEFVLGSPLLQGVDEADQLNLIFGAFGVPDRARWPAFDELPRVKKGPTSGLKFKGPSANRFSAFFCTNEDAPTDADASSTPPALHTNSTSAKQRLRAKPYFPTPGVSLMSRMLQYDPARRLTAEDALRDPFFEQSPLPQSTDMMPTFRDTNDRPRKRVRQAMHEQRAAAAAAAAAAPGMGGGL